MKISENEVEECKKKPTCKNTDRLQMWAYCVFKVWLENQQSSELDEQVTLYEKSDLYSDYDKKCIIMRGLYINLKTGIHTKYITWCVK